jgi:hypothetical protein
MNWIRNLWYARLRRIDLQVLWPTCVQQAASLTDAKAAFAAHVFNDPAWQVLGLQEIAKTIDGLTGEEK